MTIDQFVRDLDRVVELVRDRFNKHRVVLRADQCAGKRLVWFEDSAHNPPFEEPERFNGVPVEVLRPMIDSEEVSEHASGAR